MTPAFTFIYVLRDPRSGAIRYVGKADKPKKRLNDHLRQCKCGETYRARWLRSLLAEGLRPILEVVDEVAQVEWPAAECAYVAFYKEQGCPLVNATLGGDSLGAGEAHPLYGKPRSPETRAKLSAALKGRKPPPFSLERRANMSAARIGKPMSVATREKLRAANSKWRPSPEQNARRIAAQIGRRHSPETIVKMRMAAAHRVIPAATRAAQLAAVTGSHHLPEHRAKRVEGLKRGWERRRLQAYLAEMWA